MSSSMTGSTRCVHLLNFSHQVGKKREIARSWEECSQKGIIPSDKRALDWKTFYTVSFNKDRQVLLGEVLDRLE